MSELRQKVAIVIQQDDGTYHQLSSASPLPVGGAITPLLKGSIFNTAVLLNTDFFATALAPTTTPCTFRIYVTMDTAGILSVRRTEVATVSERLNAEGTTPSTLVANGAYMFDIVVADDQTINLQYSVNAAILSCIIVEVDAMSP